MAFSHKWKNQFFAEISAKLEYSRENNFFQKKLVILPDTSYKYHVNRAITLEDIQKWDWFIFLRLTVGLSIFGKLALDDR